MLLAKRQLLAARLTAIGFRVLPAQVGEGWVRCACRPAGRQAACHLGAHVCTLSVLCWHPQGTYFLVADFAPLLPEGSTEGDVEVSARGVPPLPPPRPEGGHAWAAPSCVPPLRSNSHHHHPTAPAQFCQRMTIEAGVTLIPVSAFYIDRCVPYAASAVFTEPCLLLPWHQRLPLPPPKKKIAAAQHCTPCAAGRRARSSGLCTARRRRSCAPPATSWSGTSRAGAVRPAARQLAAGEGGRCLSCCFTCLHRNEFKQTSVPQHACARAVGSCSTHKRQARNPFTARGGAA